MLLQSALHGAWRDMVFQERCLASESGDLPVSRPETVANPGAEASGSAVSPSKLGMYTDLVEFFFQEPVLQFSALVIPDKSILDYSLYIQTHDDWYYRMYYEMFIQEYGKKKKPMRFTSTSRTRARQKGRQSYCGRYSACRMGDPTLQTVKRIQIVRSHEVQIVQLVDVMLGAIAYYARGLSSSAREAKDCESRSGIRPFIPLERALPSAVAKFSLSYWHPD